MPCKNLFLTVVSTIFCISLNAQESKWAFSFAPSFGIEAFDEQKTNKNIISQKAFGDFDSRFYTSQSRYSVRGKVDYFLTNHFKASAAFTYGNTINEGVVNVKEYAILPSFSFDFLENPNKGLLISAGVNIGVRSISEYYAKYSDTLTNRTFKQLELNRTGVAFQGMVGLEWEHYIDDHFGYHIGLQYFLPTTFTPNSFEVKQYFYNNEKQTSQVGTYSYRDDQEKDIINRSVKQERFYYFSVYFSAGINYRL